MDVDAADRLRGVLLAGAGVVVLLVGGWWWRAEAPTSTRAAAGIAEGESAVVREQPDAASTVLVDARTGAVIRLPVGGLAVESGQGDPGRSQERAGVAEWTERARLSPGDALIRQGQLAVGESRLLLFSCTGPGELLIQVFGGRAADPMTVGCAGAVAMIEIIGTGGLVQVSLSPAGAAPLDVRAQLMPNG
ncbi:hypothetical protein GCM10011608_13880 [Micromonospora sonchi]|uniref:Uncharacterized protein n=1 Tax=Micromonospora sonchi TaxID=1763543 RepID=A0A917TNH7_9ACTN|nr:hypothetical protein [Micromonospora sonchi]GGM30517.1 hypothetical protein GCM10011608_13880 [Micromonospora sonchi]